MVPAMALLIHRSMRPRLVSISEAGVDSLPIGDVRADCVPSLSPRFYLFDGRGETIDAPCQNRDVPSAVG